jgi:hypothetical protein
MRMQPAMQTTPRQRAKLLCARRERSWLPFTVRPSYNDIDQPIGPVTT